ncbi:hypothetical protein RHSIM_Rhsim08G0183900 [Rhododendron simsii]|uniref:Uncharacterized protein n=1 Tax=Rhododendron simsii TaxID=118357 RepID=A0A834GK37_RHOSS|nr:hypothetical protein RHSIM_Rhsim08G0183900 [Rhododendron simsii]
MMNWCLDLKLVIQVQVLDAEREEVNLSTDESGRTFTSQIEELEKREEETIDKAEAPVAGCFFNACVIASFQTLLKLLVVRVAALAVAGGERKGDFVFVPLVPLQNQRQKFYSKLRHLLHDFRWKGSGEEESGRSLACAIIRRIWKCRNDAHFSGRQCDHVVAVNIASKDSADFLDTNKPIELSRMDMGLGPVNEPQRWSPLVDGIIKINFDAGVDVQSREGGVGLVGQGTLFGS